MLIDAQGGYTVLGYLQRPLVYDVECRCFGSYQVWNSQFHLGAKATVNDLRIARAGSSLPLIFIHTNELSEEDVKDLGLVEIYSPAVRTIEEDGGLTVYEQEHP